MSKANGGERIASKKEFLGALTNALARERLEIPELGMTVLVWELTAPERIEYQEALSSSSQRIPLKRGGKRELVIESHAARGLLKLCAMSLKDEHGNRQYEEAELSRMGSRVLRRIFEAAERISGLTEEGDEEAGKDSAPSPSASASSNSPSPSAARPAASSELGSPD